MNNLFGKPNSRRKIIAAKLFFSESQKKRSIPAEATGSEDYWTRLRCEMVDKQIKARGIYDPKVLNAMKLVPRRCFLSEDQWPAAYRDAPLPIGRGQTISQPYIVALMTEALCLKGGEKVLEVGTGSGYQAAILAEIGCRVHTIERDPILSENAAKCLKRLGYDTVKLHIGDGTLGLPEEAPFKGIVATAAGPKIPERLKAQLDPAGGIMVIPVGGRTVQELLAIKRNGDVFTEKNLGACCFVPLVGENGW